MNEDLLETAELVENPREETLMTKQHIIYAVATAVALSLPAYKIVEPLIPESTPIESNVDFGVQKTEVGKLIKLEVEGLDVTWTTDPDIKNGFSVDNTKRFVFVPDKPGRQAVVASFIYGGEVAVRKWVFLVSDNFSVFSEWSYLAKKFPGNIEDRNSFADVFSASREDILRSVRESKLLSPEKILELTAENAKKQGISTAEWDSFVDLLRVKLSEKAKNGTLTTNADYARAWDEIAKVLEVKTQT